jgi:NADP-reducing hydrogenase subunit HndB
MAKLTFEDLKQIREKTANAMALRLGQPRATVTVHLGTCGIAAGARDVMNALITEIAASNSPDIRAIAAGCMGQCASEPHVTVELEGSEPVTYQQMNPDKIQQVFKRHVIKGEIINDFVLNLA